MARARLTLLKWLDAPWDIARNTLRDDMDSLENVVNKRITSLPGLPTSPTGLAVGDLWVDTSGGLNLLKIIV